MQSVMKVWLMPDGGVQAVLIAAEHPSSRFVRFNNCFAPVLLVLPPQIRFDLFPPPDWIKRAAGSANSPFLPCFLVVSAFCLICLVCLERKLFTLSFWNFNSWMAVVRQVRFTVALEALALAFLSNLFLFLFCCFLSFLAIFAAFFFCLAIFFLGLFLLPFLPPLPSLPAFPGFLFCLLLFLLCLFLFFFVFFPLVFLGLSFFCPFLGLFFLFFCLFLHSFEFGSFLHAFFFPDFFELLATLLSTGSATRS